MPKRKRRVYKVFTIRLTRCEWETFIRFSIIMCGIGAYFACRYIFHEITLSEISMGAVMPETIRAISEVIADVISDT